MGVKYVVEVIYGTTPRVESQTAELPCLQWKLYLPCDGLKETTLRLEIVVFAASDPERIGHIWTEPCG